ncbi:CLUMA_CG011026, isoform A [Clunio marinus]|uniref:Luciferin 4-monooxygenase n=1 Tax=Clunio marinus TaxID=568069 RepID=A0A1J1IGT1_9DIPT|nr:CLUMA_CG011026, isoform A [Clunio marinus]
MFRRALKNILRKELLDKCQSDQKIFARTILTSQRTFYKPNLADSENDIFVYSPLPSINYPDISIDQYVWNDFNKWTSKTAVVDGVTERAITYGQLRDRCRALAIRLQSVFHLNHNDTIAVCLPNSIEFPIVALAGLEAGFIVTTVNPIYTADEISRQLNDSGAKVIFGLASMSNVLRQAVAMTKKPIRVVYCKETESEALPVDGVNFNDLISTEGIDLGSLKTFDIDADDVAMLPYSSGTTGLSKGVKLSHKNIVSNSMQINSDTGKGCLTYPAIGTHQDVLPCVLPFFHIYGLTCTLLSKLAHGCKLVTLPRFTPDTFLNVLEKHDSSVLYLVPPIIIFMSNCDKLQEKHTKSIKYVMSGAAPIGSLDADRFNLKAPNAKFFQGYGLTEAAPVALMSVLGSNNHASVGFPTPDGEAKIVLVGDTEFRGVGPNVSGELLVRGPQVMKGYHNNEKATNETITADGWLRTGDIGHYDENFEFYITDRLKELIKVKGFQVPPAELEEILRNHPDIADAAVIGIPHPTAGELPRAYVVAKNKKLTEKDVKKFVSKKVAEYKRLEGGVEFVDVIPKNATGKILRRELKDRYKSST